MECTTEIITPFRPHEGVRNRNGMDDVDGLEDDLENDDDPEDDDTDDDFAAEEEDEDDDEDEEV